MDRKLLKTNAKQSLKSHYGTLVLITLITGAMVYPFITRNVDQLVLTNLQNPETAPAQNSILTVITARFAEGNTSAAILAIVIAVLFLLLTIFVLQSLNVIQARFHTEARTYEKVPMSHFFFLRSAGQYMNTSMHAFRAEFQLGLWSLTIVGGFIKFFSYLLVPYILAENPKLTGKEAILLSRKMMDGHKAEAFVLYLSMIGWELLSVITLGYAGIFFVNPYFASIKANYWADLRENYLKEHEEAKQLLNDPYLYAKAAPVVLSPAYKDHAMDEAYIRETQITLSGFKAFLANVVGIQVGSKKEVKVYRGVESLQSQSYEDHLVLNGEVYPTRLAPWFTNEMKHFNGYMSADQTYSIPTLLFLAVFYSVLGYLWMAAACLHHDFTFSPVLTGPWIPAFGLIAMLVQGLGTKMRGSYISDVIFTMIIVLAGLVLIHFVPELVAADLPNAVIAGSGAAMCTVYVLSPYLDYITHRKDNIWFPIISIVLFVIMIADVIMHAM